MCKKRKRLQYESVPAWKRCRNTAVFLLAVRFLYQIPMPGMDHVRYQNILQTENETGFFNLLMGNAPGKISIMTLGISTYITATILLQLLAVCSKRIETMRNGSKSEKRRINGLTLLISLFLSLLQGILMLEQYAKAGLLLEHSGRAKFMILCIWTGTALLLSVFCRMMSERHDLFIGNGISLVLVSNLVSSYPEDLQKLFDGLQMKWTGLESWLLGCGILGFLVLLFLFLIVIKRVEVRIPLRYVSANDRVYDASLTYLPVKLCPSSVIPVVFAASLFSLPELLQKQFAIFPERWMKLFRMTDWFNDVDGITLLGMGGYLGLIVLIAVFYPDLTKSAEDLATELRTTGAVIPNRLPGPDTAAFLKQTRRRYALYGAVFLSVLVFLPMLLSAVLQLQGGVSFLGTSAIILTDVLLDTKEEITVCMRKQKADLQYQPKIKIFGNSKRALCIPKTGTLVMETLQLLLLVGSSSMVINAINYIRIP